MVWMEEITLLIADEYGSEGEPSSGAIVVSSTFYDFRSSRRLRAVSGVLRPDDAKNHSAVRGSDAQGTRTTAAIPADTSHRRL